MWFVVFLVTAGSVLGMASFLPTRRSVAIKARLSALEAEGPGLGGVEWAHVRRVTERRRIRADRKRTLARIGSWSRGLGLGVVVLGAWSLAAVELGPVWACAGVLGLVGLAFGLAAVRAELVALSLPSALQGLATALDRSRSLLESLETARRSSWPAGAELSRAGQAIVAGLPEERAFEAFSRRNPSRAARLVAKALAFGPARRLEWPQALSTIAQLLERSNRSRWVVFWLGAPARCLAGGSLLLAGGAMATLVVQRRGASDLAIGGALLLLASGILIGRDLMRPNWARRLQLAAAAQRLFCDAAALAQVGMSLESALGTSLLRQRHHDFFEREMLRFLQQARLAADRTAAEQLLAQRCRALGLVGLAAAIEAGAGDPERLRRGLEGAADSLSQEWLRAALQASWRDLLWAFSATVPTWLLLARAFGR